MYVSYNLWDAWLLLCFYTCFRMAENSGCYRKSVLDGLHFVSLSRLRTSFSGFKIYEPFSLNIFTLHLWNVLLHQRYSISMEWRNRVKKPYFCPLKGHRTTIAYCIQPASFEIQVAQYDISSLLVLVRPFSLGLTVLSMNFFLVMVFLPFERSPDCYYSLPLNSIIASTL